MNLMLGTVLGLVPVAAHPSPVFLCAVEIPVVSMECMKSLQAHVSVLIPGAIALL
jgi:hypothetical protein